MYFERANAYYYANERGRCHRCNGSLIKSYEDVVCLSCGFDQVPLAPYREPESWDIQNEVNDFGVMVPKKRKYTRRQKPYVSVSVAKA